MIFSQRFEVDTATFYNPTILLRRPISKSGIWEVTARIDAGKAIINKDTGKWDLYTQVPDSNEWLPYGRMIERDPEKPIENIASYTSDITARDIPLRVKSENISLMSLKQLIALASQSKKIRDMAQLLSQKHFRITEPIISMVMLMISLPILVCRDPKGMKSAVLLSF